MRALAHEQWTGYVHPTLQRRGFEMDAAAMTLTDGSASPPFPLEGRVEGVGVIGCPYPFTFSDYLLLRVSRCEMGFESLRDTIDIRLWVRRGRPGSIEDDGTTYILVGTLSRKDWAYTHWELTTAYVDEDERRGLAPELVDEPPWYADWQKESHP